MEIILGALIAIGLIAMIIVLMYLQEDEDDMYGMQGAAIVVIIGALSFMYFVAYDKGYDDAKQEQLQQQIKLINKGVK